MASSQRLLRRLLVLDRFSLGVRTDTLALALALALVLVLTLSAFLLPTNSPATTSPHARLSLPTDDYYLLVTPTISLHSGGTQFPSLPVHPQNSAAYTLLEPFSYRSSGNERVLCYQLLRRYFLQ